MNLIPLSTCAPFPAEPVIVGINSFGFGGANGHAVIEEYQQQKEKFYLQPSMLEEKYPIYLSSPFIIYILLHIPDITHFLSQLRVQRLFTKQLQI
jgi:Ketoacyl-synthetase C-terminal extension